MVSALGRNGAGCEGLGMWGGQGAGGEVFNGEVGEASLGRWHLKEVREQVLQGHTEHP